MRFSTAIINNLASYICGDEPLPFPYRTGSQLYEFFVGLGIDYNPTGLSRNPGVRKALTALNQAAPSDGHMPPPAMVSLIEELMDAAYFDASRPERVRYEEALDTINELLSPYSLEILRPPLGTRPTLRHSHGTYVSSVMKQHDASRKITFCPSVFKIPDEGVSRDLVAVMMPFAAQFTPVYESIKLACRLADLQCQRADDIWKDTTIIQDIFHLIFTSSIVVVDFTDKNPNVMYETGIAHTLGKHVVPITQSMSDVPFDLQSHRILRYLHNSEGLDKLQKVLTQRLLTIVSENKPSSPPKTSPGTPPSSRLRHVHEPGLDDDIPF